MAYEPTLWKDRAIERPLTFNIINNPDGTVTLVPVPGAVVEPGTPVNANNLNKLEQGLKTHEADYVNHDNNDTTAHNGNIGKVKHNDIFYDVVVGNPFYDEDNSKGLSFGANAASIVDDGDSFIVGSGSVQGPLKRYDKKTLEVITMGAKNLKIDSMEVDGNHIFAASILPGGLYGLLKIDKNTFETIDSFETHPTQVHNIVVDDNYLYLTIGSGTPIKKYNKSTLVHIGDSSIAGSVYAIYLDENYIYIGGSTKNIQKLDKNTLQIIGTSSDFGGRITAIALDENYIYVAGETTSKINKYDKNTLDLVSSSTTFSATNARRILSVDDNYLYALIEGVGCLIYDKSDMSKVYETTAIIVNSALSAFCSDSALYTCRNSSGVNIRVYDILNRILGVRRVM